MVNQMTKLPAEYDVKIESRVRSQYEIRCATVD